MPMAKPAMFLRWLCAAACLAMIPCRGEAYASSMTTSRLTTALRCPRLGQAAPLRVRGGAVEEGVREQASDIEKSGSAWRSPCG